MVPGTVDDPAIVTCVAVEKFHSMYGTPELCTPLKFPGVQEKLLATPLVSTLMISGMVELGELLNVRVEISARLAAEISRTFCAPGVSVTLAFVPGESGKLIGVPFAFVSVTELAQAAKPADWLANEPNALAKLMKPDWLTEDDG